MYDYSLGFIKMKKLIPLFLPMAIIFSLAGCQLDTETVYIKKDLRKIASASATTSSTMLRYEVRINGNWYDADKNGNLTQRGQMQKQAAESSGDDGGGGGGGC